MSVKRPILLFGFDKNGEAEFGAVADVMNLSREQMTELRAMIPVGIAQMENMWMREQQRKGPAQAAAQDSGEQ